MRATLYLRVSTEEQAREGYSISAQRERLEAFAISQGWMVVKTFSDEGFSGKNLKRPGMKQMIEDVEAGLTDVVVVWKLDRLSRRQIDVLHLIEDVFAPHKVGFRSATESFDTTTPAGMAMLGMLAVFAQLERATIIERTTFGYTQRISEGKWAGSAPYGYRYGQNGVLEPNPESADWLRSIYIQAISGSSLDRIVDWLAAEGAPPPFGRKSWYPSTVKIILHNRAYLGERRTRNGWIRSGHSALLDEETWVEAQEAVESRRKGPGRPRRGEISPYLLTGLLFCGECGSRMGGHKNSQGVRYYICDQIKRTGHRCGPGYVRIERLDEQVAAKLLVAVRTKRPATPRKRRSEVAAIDARIANLVAAIEDGTLPHSIVRERLEKLQRERAQSLREQGPVVTKVARNRVLAAGLPRVWANAEHKERQEILRALLQRIDVDPSGTPHLNLRT
ncbi:MAG: recombinase family protein [Acidobacteriaceae bacterium]